MSTQELGMYIEREYPYFKRMARYFNYSREEWVDDILQDALMEVWNARYKIQNEGNIKNFIVTVIKITSYDWFARNKKHCHTNIEDGLYHLEDADEQENVLSDEIWNRYREESCKRIDDSLFLMSPVGIGEFSFTPVGCSMTLRKSYTPARIDKNGTHRSHFFQAVYRIEVYSTYGKGVKRQKKVKYFSTKAEAANYVRAVRALIAQNTPPPLH